MAEKDNVESNPVLAFGLAGVALVGVLAGLLPPGLLERMVEQDAVDSSVESASSSQLVAPAPVGMTPQQSVSGSEDVVVVPAREESQQTDSEPAGTVPTAPLGSSTSLVPVPPASGDGNLQRPVESAPQTRSGLEVPSQPETSTPAPSSVNLPRQAPVYRRADEWVRPPEPVYPAPVSPWSAYPGYGYPPGYDPHYGQPGR